MSGRPTRICVSCGRAMAYRKRWARDWESVRYCSKACRRRRVGDTDRALERAILDLLSRRPRSVSVCPSEAARAVDPAGWRNLLEATRRAARRLVAAHRLEMVQRGQVVDPSTARGPVRLRRPRHPR